MNQTPQGVFENLKIALKARKISYKQLASNLNVSEATIKRMFQERDCKLGRLTEICEVLQIPLQDMISKPKSDVLEATRLPANVSDVLAKNESLLFFLILLMDRYKPTEIVDIYGLTSADAYLYLRDLEKLGVISLKQDMQYEFVLKPPIDVLSSRSLSAVIKKVNMAFLTHVMDKREHEDYTFMTLSRHMRPETAYELRKDLQTLHEKMKRQSGHDQLLYPVEQLCSMKWTVAFAPTPFKKILTVKRHVKNNSDQNI